MKRPKVSEAISPLTKSRHFANTRGIARLAATATKHDLYIAPFLIVRDHPELRRFECARVTYFLGGVFVQSTFGNNLLNLRTTEPTL
jgi:hypothetical protein